MPQQRNHGSEPRATWDSCNSHPPVAVVGGLRDTLQSRVCFGQFVVGVAKQHREFVLAGIWTSMPIQFGQGQCLLPQLQASPQIRNLIVEKEGNNKALAYELYGQRGFDLILALLRNEYSPAAAHHKPAPGKLFPHPSLGGAASAWVCRPSTASTRRAL